MNNRIDRRIKLCLQAAAIALMSLTLFACASHKPMEVTSSDAVIAAVNPGDEVNIVSKNGKLYRFTVSRMTNKALYAADGTRVTYAEMGSIEARSKKDGVFKRIGNLF